VFTDRADAEACAQRARRLDWLNAKVVEVESEGAR
jgi:hypothetical protein